jgi:hypothetical protein
MLRNTVSKKLLISCVVMATVFFVGCKKDAEVNAVLTELDSFTKELVQKLKPRKAPLRVSTQPNNIWIPKRRILRKDSMS